MSFILIKFFLFTSFFFTPLLTLHAEQLKFQFHEGEQYRFYGESNQQVLLNFKTLQFNNDTYKTSYKVSDATSEKGKISGTILYTSHRKGEVSASLINQEINTEYELNTFGNYNIDPKYTMPVVRNVPSFSEKDLTIGDTWSAPGEEFEDLSEITMFNKDGPIPALKVPFIASYKYLGTQKFGDKSLQKIQVDYNLLYKTNFSAAKYEFFPQILTGVSHQIIYFDNLKGRIDHYTEDYSLILVLNTGDVYEFTGTSLASLTEAKEMDQPKLVDEVKKGLEQQGLGEVKVSTSDKGVVLNLDNINFPADSAQLLPSEAKKLQSIGEILSKYPDRDISVEGHTALAGTEEDRMILSQARAKAVGDFLVKNQVRTPEHLTYRGWGSNKPLVPNDSEENKKKNRRVEIILLEN